MYDIDLITTLTPLCEGSLLFISEISKAGNAKFNKIRSLGGRQLIAKILLMYLSLGKYQCCIIL